MQGGFLLHRACLFLLSVSLLGAQTVSQAIKTDKLPNGLELVFAEDHSRPVINVQVWYHVGSKDEREGRTGFAHLFEHLMFRGSNNVGPEEHMRLIREAGGRVNAYTSFDRTVYWETIPSNYLERMLWLEADRMSSLTINAENFKKELEVVKEERRLRTDNPPFGRLAEAVLDATYEKYPYKHAPIGSMEDLNKSSVADVQEFFNTFYVPNNATLVIVGDFDSAQALSWARKYFGPIPQSKNPVPRVTATEPDQAEHRERNVPLPNIPLPAVVSAYHLPPLGTPDSYPLQIASSILSRGESSRLYKQLVYKEQTAVFAAGQAQELEGPSLFFGYGVANRGKDVKEVSSSMQAVFEGMRKEPVTAEELTKAKNQIISSDIEGRQSMQGKADAIGRAASLLRDPNLYNTEIQKYQSVSAADIQRVCQKYLVANNETRLFISQAPAGGK